MGNCGGGEEGDKNSLVQDQIRQLQKQEQKVHKLLLLGTGNSGKSTFFKQLTQIHGGGFREEEFMQSAKHIQDSVVVQMKNLLTAVTDSNQQLEPDLENVVKVIKQVSPEQPLSSVASQISKLWANQIIRTAWQSRSNLGISDSAPHFFDDLQRIADDNYRPTAQDILLARIPTTGIRNKKFTIQNNVFDVYDVGGQRSERSKWIHCFETVHAILFVSSLNCFDQMLYEENVNAMSEALDLFSQVVNSRYFRRTSMIVFLNKSDLFEEKIKVKKLSVCFQDYEFILDDQDDPEMDEFTYATDFVRDQFKNQCFIEDKQIYSHVTCATDRGNVERVFDDVQHSVVMNALKNNGLM